MSITVVPVFTVDVTARTTSGSHVPYTKLRNRFQSMYIRQPCSAPLHAKLFVGAGGLRFSKSWTKVAARDGLSGRPMMARRQVTGTHARTRGIMLSSISVNRSTSHSAYLPLSYRRASGRGPAARRHEISH